MNKAMLLVGIILLGILGFGAFNVIQNYTVGNELDYYLLKETVEAAMTDAVDTGFYYREYGTYRMDKAKFVESFALHFVSNVDTKRYYRIKFFDINELPPKATVRVESATSETFNGESIQIKTDLSSIVEARNTSDPVSQKAMVSKD